MHTLFNIFRVSRRNCAVAFAPFLMQVCRGNKKTVLKFTINVCTVHTVYERRNI